MPQEKVLLNAAEVADILGVKLCTAYKIIREYNKELQDMGKLVLPGKINAKYFYKKIEV